MRQATRIRDLVVARTRDMLEHLRLQVAMLPETELDVLRVLERPQQADLVVAASNFVLERLGSKPTAPKDPRFDKTHRALARQTKPPRGVPKPPKRKSVPTVAPAVATPETSTDG